MPVRHGPELREAQPQFSREMQGGIVCLREGEAKRTTHSTGNVLRAMP